jgi:outer membrane biosynthesis protein TonB
MLPCQQNQWNYLVPQLHHLPRSNKAKLSKAALTASLVMHVLLVVGGAWFAKDSWAGHRFLVYGAHSSKEVKAFFAPLRAIVPRSEASVASRTSTSLSKTPIQGKVKKPVASQKRENASGSKKQVSVPDSKTNSLQKESATLRKNLPSPSQSEKKTIKNPPVVSAPASQKVAPPKSTLPIVDAQSARQAPRGAGNTLREDVIQSYQRVIQREVERLWRPPVGVARGTECTVCLTVDGNGNVAHFEIVASSNIMVYDLSVIRVVPLFKFDRSLWGKSFTIDFRQ